MAKGATEVEIAPGNLGDFEITIDGNLVYSKQGSGEFPSDGEIDALVEGQG